MQTEPSRPLHCLRILVVEDHQDSALLFCRLLQRMGYQAEAVHTVAAAVQTARQRPFDLLISDLSLPDGDGFDVLRQLDSSGRLPAISLSGHAADSDICGDGTFKFDSHLTKPVNITSLVAAIEHAMQRDQC